MTRDQKTAKKVALLLDAVERIHPPLKTLMWRSFLTGIFTGLGATVGVSIILALVTFLLGQVQVIPGLQRVSTIEKILPQK